MPKSIVPMLLRTRPVASGPWLRLHAMRIGGQDEAHARPAPGGPESGPDAGRHPGSTDHTGRRGLLVVNVPKRFCRRAVERNAIRRVAREAWRASGLHDEPVDLLVRVHASPWTAARARSAHGGTMSGRDARTRRASPRGAVESGSGPERSAGGASDAALAERAPQRSLPMLKRRARRELDDLFEHARTGLHKRRMLR